MDFHDAASGIEDFPGYHYDIEYASIPDSASTIAARSILVEYELPLDDRGEEDYERVITTVEEFMVNVNALSFDTERRADVDPSLDFKPQIVNAYQSLIECSRDTLNGNPAIADLLNSGCLPIYQHDDEETEDNKKAIDNLVKRMRFDITRSQREGESTSESPWLEPYKIEMMMRRLIDERAAWKNVSLTAVDMWSYEIARRALILAARPEWIAD